MNSPCRESVNPRRPARVPVSSERNRSHHRVTLAVLLVAFLVGCKGKGTEAAGGAPGAAATGSAAASAHAKAEAPPTSPCPEGMVLLAGGRFLRGSDRGPDAGTLDERPAREIDVAAFCLDRTEVTVESYAVCVDAGVCSKPREKDPPYAWADQFNWGKADRKKHPMNGVSFRQASAYCKHVGKRLPSEAEWEFAARGTDGRVHPWGKDAPGAKLLNVCDTSCRAEGLRHKLAWVAMFEEADGFVYTAPVGSYPAGATPEGILDLEGNVGEWTEGAPCPYEKPDCGAKGNVLRGSTWLDQFKGEVRSSGRPVRTTGDGYATSGVRCAK